MSTTSLHSLTDSYSRFSSRSQPNRMSQSQTPGLDTLAEGSQYALEQLRLARQAGVSNAPTDPGHNLLDATGATEPHHLQSYNEQKKFNGGEKMPMQQRDALEEARSTIRKASSAGPVRRRISRACDQCNQLRTKCDGQQPCAHCLGT